MITHFNCSKDMLMTLEHSQCLMIGFPKPVLTFRMRLRLAWRAFWWILWRQPRFHSGLKGDVERAFVEIAERGNNSGGWEG